MLSEAFGGKELSTTMNADESVARGAALQAAILSPLYKAGIFFPPTTSQPDSLAGALSLAGFARKLFACYSVYLLAFVHPEIHPWRFGYNWTTRSHSMSEYYHVRTNLLGSYLAPPIT